uniref:Chemokine interleukin-8-like domain-containing protein n=1 Tax=Terrapene triunguis TaxID=2587831 RepID=A0A674J5P5_9SAUR
VSNYSNVLATVYLYHCSLQDGITISATPVECCFNYVTGAIQLAKLVDFYWTPLETIPSRVCADPSKPWVKRAIRVLEAKRKQTSLSENHR